MGEHGGDEEKTASEPSQPPFLEVACKSSGKVRRFATGTEAGFALHLINSKLGTGVPLALHIEAVKGAEEPVSFGPTATLINYGKGWKLQTVTEDELGYEEEKRVQQTAKPFSYTEQRSHIRSSKRSTTGPTQTYSFPYFAKILVAFAFIFVLGGTFTLFLENLPRLILYVTSFL